MATIHFVDANNNIDQVYSFSSQIVPRCIVICDQNGTARYIPTDGAGHSSYNENMGSYTNRYYYNSSKPSLHAVASDNSICNAYNAISTISNASIPAGTYVGQSAYNTFHSYITNGGNRRLAASVTIRHMNITRTFSAGQYVWLSYGYSGKIINLTFGSYGPSGPGEACDAGGNSYKQWWSSSANYPTIQLRRDIRTGTWSTKSFTLQNNLVFA